MNSIIDFSLGGLYKNVTICMLGWEVMET
jgi:hypothetical protein